MTMSDILEILEAHRESYDMDCGYHHGCSCDWEPTHEDAVSASRLEWRKHLAEQVETYIELRITEVLRELH